VLWDIGPQATTQDVVQLLQTRFGTKLQAECFKAELRVRRRAPGKTLQALYQDIHRLVSLAYPGAGPQLVMHATLKAFIVGLNNPALQLEVFVRLQQLPRAGVFDKGKMTETGKCSPPLRGKPTTR